MKKTLMKKNLLILHHFENRWEKGLNESGTSIYFEIEKVKKFLKRYKIDKVVITKHKNKNFEIDYFEIMDVCEALNIEFEIKKYGYGWKIFYGKRWDYKTLNSKWCYGNRIYHNENDVLPIFNWIKGFKKYNVMLGGFFEYECVNDMETVLKALKINYRLIKSLTVR